PGMVLHLEFVERALSPSGLWDTGFQFGDWLDPDASPHDPGAAKADKGVVATACLIRSARFAAAAPRLSGEGADAGRGPGPADGTTASSLRERCPPAACGPRPSSSRTASPPTPRHTTPGPRRPTRAWSPPPA